MKPIAQRAINTKVSAIKRIAAEAKKDPQVISLSQGIPSFSTPEYIRKGVAQSLLSDEPGIGKYSVYMGLPELRQAIAKRLSGEFGTLVDPNENVFVTAGGMEGLLAVMLALIDPGDEVLVPSPDYGPHFQHIHLAGGKAVLVPLAEEKGWWWDARKVEAKVTPKTKLILFTNPGNPTGNVFDKATLLELAKIAREHDLWVLVDETYHYLTYDDTPFVASAKIPDFAGRLVTVRTFSKEYAMTGWRLGYVCGPKEVIGQALKMHDPMVISASTISQKAGLLAFDGDCRVVTKMVAELARRRTRFINLLSEFAPYFTFIPPKGAYYVFARLKKSLMEQLGPTSEEFAFRMLKEAKVAVVPGSEFRPPEDLFVRFSFAGEVAMMEEAMDRIKKWIKALSVKC